MPDQKLIRIKPIIAILCDDIRQEGNGKPFIIGIYTAGITLQESINSFGPSNAKPILPLALWVAYEASEAGKAEIEFQIVAPNPERKILITAGVELHKTPPSYEILTLAFTGLMVPIECAGDIKVMFRHQEDGDWQTLRTIPVTFGSSNPESANIKSATHSIANP